MAWTTITHLTNADIIREERQRVLDTITRLGSRLIGETITDGHLVLTFTDGS